MMAPSKCARCGVVPEIKVGKAYDGVTDECRVTCPKCGAGTRASGPLTASIIEDAVVAWDGFYGARRPHARALSWAAVACACVCAGALGSLMGPVVGGAVMGAAALVCAALSCLAAGGDR